MRRRGIFIPMRRAWMSSACEPSGRRSRSWASIRPPRRGCHDRALGGDLLANGVYYSLVGAGGSEGALRRGALLGLLAGLGAVALPAPLGLGSEPSKRTPATQLMTVAW